MRNVKCLLLFYTKYKMKIEYLQLFFVGWFCRGFSFDKQITSASPLYKKYNLGYDERYNYHHVYNHTFVSQQNSKLWIYKYDCYEKMLKTFSWMKKSHFDKNIHHFIPREIQNEITEDMEDFLRDSSIQSNGSLQRFQIKNGGLLSNSDWCEKDEW